MDFIETLVTEQVNENTKQLDQLNTVQILELINSEDQQVPHVIKQLIPEIAAAVELIVHRLQNGGRLLYIGAGTSGRIGILDASECPPTFGTDPALIKGIIAGGTTAIQDAIEGAEDNEELGRADVVQHQVSSVDTLVGIAASGRTPYVIGAMKQAKAAGAKVISICNNHKTPMSEHADVSIEAVVGPEAVMGSTRMKAGTAQKLILNMLSTTAMIRLGKVYDNLMVDVQATNHKLLIRAKKIIQLATSASEETVDKAFLESGGHAKTAIIMILAKVDAQQAKQLLDESSGYVRKAIELMEKR